MKFKIVSMYTVGTEYEKEAKELEKTLIKQKVDYKIYPTENKKDWILNCGQKPGIIAKAMREFPESAIVWIDADASLVSYPKLFEQIDADIGYHMFSKVPGDRNYKRGAPPILLSGTLFFNNSPISKKIVSDWETLCNKERKWDQRVLQNLVQNKYNGKIKTHILPIEYVKIFDKGKPTKTPVILHHMASRSLKRVINCTEKINPRKIQILNRNRRFLTK